MLAMLLNALSSSVARLILKMLGISIVALTIYHYANKIGQLKGAATQLETDNTKFSAERVDFVNQLKQTEAAKQALQTQLANSEQQVANLSATVTKLEQQSHDADVIVQNLPPDALFLDITGKLSIRNPGDVSTQFSTPELRQIDEDVTQYPLIISENLTLQSEDAALNNEVTNLKSLYQADEDELKQTIAYINTLSNEYVEAYNVAQKVRKHSWFFKIVTLGLVHDPHLNIPTPLDLDSLKPSVAKTGIK
jgi:hypothetical protein